jgi:hypothetical protein
MHCRLEGRLSRLTKCWVFVAPNGHALEVRLTPSLAKSAKASLSDWPTEGQPATLMGSLIVMNAKDNVAIPYLIADDLSTSTIQ